MYQPNAITSLPTYITTLGPHYSCSTRRWTNQQQSASPICWCQWRKSSSHPGLWCEICGLAKVVECRHIAQTGHALYIYTPNDHVWRCYTLYYLGACNFQVWCYFCSSDGLTWLFAITIAVLFLLCMLLLRIPCRRLRHAVRDTVSLTTQLLAVMGVSVSAPMLHQMSTIILSLWIQQLHQTSHEVLPTTSALLLVLTSVTLHVIATPAKNQPNSVESQRPLKSVSKHLWGCS